MKPDKTPLIGIALDSGGARGGAHIGVLDVFNEHNIPLDLVVGSSAGAFVGALYAAGKIDIIKDIMNDMSWMESLGFYLDPVFPISGLLAGRRARVFIKDIVGDITIEELPIRFVAVATDLLTGETVAIDKGPLVDAIIASISMPGIFKPVIYMGRLLTDGGVSEPLPLDVLKSYAPRITIACNLHPRLSDRFKPGQKKAIIKTQMISDQEDDIASWIISRMIDVIKSQRMLDNIMPAVKNFAGKIGNTYTGRPLKMKGIDPVALLQNQLNLSKDKVTRLVENSFAKKGKKASLNIFEIMAISTDIQQYQKNRLMLCNEKPDVLISPDVTYIGSLEFTKAQEAIKEGRDKAIKAIPGIKALLEPKL
ncbi:MAG: patatin-like phospholipase family protein [Thermodesulfobacteriota bacterium]|nr:patatin-like phospholipase family protein [Thermodesulfobacteriota bacterium]